MQIIFNEQDQPKCQPDPYIIRANGKFYIYTTGTDAIHCYASDTLESGWSYVGAVYSRDGEKEYWAPCIYEENGVYYMYFSSMPRSSDDCHDERIQVAISDKPEGPFTCVKELLPPFSIDPHIVKSDGQLYMFYSVNDYNAKRAGTYIVVQKMDSPVLMRGKPVTALKPTLDEEIFMRDRFKKDQHWHTLEGAFYFREKNHHYLIYSGNCWQNEHYYLGYAVAESESGDLTSLNFKKHPSPDVYSPLICANEIESGTGHNSMIKLDDQYYCIYHGRDVGDVKPYDNRTARLCRIDVNNGTLTAIRK